MSVNSVIFISYFIKVIVVGEVNTGKSAILRRYVHNFFSNKGDYRATLGVDFNLKLIHYNDELEIRLQLWDIAGQVFTDLGSLCGFGLKLEPVFHCPSCLQKEMLDSKGVKIDSKKITSLR
jgi:GTPase SAR1 family protein